MANLKVIYEDIEVLENEDGFEPLDVLIDPLLEKNRVFDAITSLQFFTQIGADDRLESDEEFEELKSMLSLPEVAKVDRSNFEERSNVIKNNSETIARVMDKYDPKIIDKMIKTERLHTAISTIESKRKK